MLELTHSVLETQFLNFLPRYHTHSSIIVFYLSEKYSWENIFTINIILTPFSSDLYATRRSGVHWKDGYSVGMGTT